jgi:hypothetical protein
MSRWHAWANAAAFLAVGGACSRESSPGVV